MSNTVQNINSEREIRNKIMQEFNNSRAENLALKEKLDKANKMLYDLIAGLNKMHTAEDSSDYFFAVELLLTNEVESWFENNKEDIEKDMEQERLRLLRLNALNKLSNEEKQALGLI
jgi:hypothetical protein